MKFGRRYIRFKLLIHKNNRRFIGLVSFVTIGIIIATVVVCWKLHLLNILGPNIRRCFPLQCRTNTNANISIGIVTFHLYPVGSNNNHSSKPFVTGPASRKNLAAYAHYQHYPLIREDNISVNLNLGKYAKVWAKVDALKKHLKDFEWLVWIDSDLLIMNFNRRLETFLPSNNYIDVVIATDKLGINAGIFMWRNSPSGHEILERWSSMATSSVHEQKQLSSLLEKDVKIARQVQILPLCAFNSYMIANRLTTRYEYGDFAVHFVGGTWYLQTYIYEKYGWDLFNHFADLAGTDGVTLTKWLGWNNIVRLFQLPWRP